MKNTVLVDNRVKAEGKNLVNKLDRLLVAGDAGLNTVKDFWFANRFIRALDARRRERKNELGGVAPRNFEEWCERERKRMERMEKRQK